MKTLRRDARAKPVENESLRRDWFERPPESEILALALAASLRQLRLLAGLTLGELETRTRIHRPILSRIENGHNVPRLDTIYRYCAGVGFHPVHALRCVDDLQEELFG